MIDLILSIANMLLAAYYGYLALSMSDHTGLFWVCAGCWFIASVLHFTTYRLKTKTKALEE